MGEEKNHAGEFEENWPDVSENAIDADSGESAITDKKGNIFNSADHIWDDENNQPKYNKDGTFRSRPKRKVNTKKSKAEKQDEIDEATARELGAQQAAQVCVNMQVLMGMYMGGDEWAPGKDEFGNNEYEAGIEAYKSCMMAYDMTYLPPWLPPCIWTIGFFGRRIMKDKVIAGKLSENLKKIFGFSENTNDETIE